MEASIKSIKFPEDKYIRYGKRIGLRVCNSNYEYITLIKQNYYNKPCYKIKLTNIHPFIKLDSEDYMNFVEESSNTFVESGWYLMNICNIINPTKKLENEYVQFGDVVFLCTRVDKEFLILGYDPNNLEIKVSSFNELSHNNINGMEFNSLKRSLKNYEWVIEKIPISKEESISERVCSLPAPNINSMRFSDIFLIRVSESDDVMFSEDSIKTSNNYMNNLSLGKIAIAGKSGYWAILPSDNSEFPLPNWYKMRKILKGKKMAESYSFFSNNRSFIDIDSMRNLKLNELTADYFSNLKIPRLKVGMINLVSGPPFGWDDVNSNSVDLKVSGNNKSTEIGLEVSTSFFGYLFDHSGSFCSDIVTENNFSLIPLDRYPSNIQEQLLLEDILCCLMCIEGNYIKVIEHINTVEKVKNYDFSETLFLIQDAENNSLNNREIKNISFSVFEGLSTFSHYVTNDPKKMTSIDIFKDTKIFGELEYLSKFNTSIERDYCEFSKVDNSDPVILPLTYRILELSSLNMRIRQFLDKHENGNTNLGLISNTLCETFRELLKHFEIKISRFETLIRKGTLTLQNLWSQSQQALATLKTMDLIATHILYKRGCEIINIIFDLIQERFQGENSNIKVANFILSQLLMTWIKHFLIPWTMHGHVNDSFFEFGHFGSEKSDELANTEMLFSRSLFRKDKEKYLLNLFTFPKCLRSIFKEVNYIGSVNKLISRFQNDNKAKKCGKYIDSLCLKIDLEKIMQLLDLNSDVIKFDSLCEYFQILYNECKTKLYRFCCERINLNNYLMIFKDIFMCSNDLFIQEFIDCIGVHSLGGNLSGNCYNNYISHKWNVLASNYCRKYINEYENFELHCIFDEKLITEKIVSLYSRDEWNIDDSLKGVNNNNAKRILNFEAFKHLSVNLNTKSCIIREIWTEEILEKYQILFRFIFHLKYIQRLLTDTWFIQKITPLWGYIIENPEINKFENKRSLIYTKIGKSYILRHKMLSIINSILEYITYDVVEPSWNKFIKELENVNTIEEIVDSQNKTLDEIMTLCFCSNYESFCSLYKMISICHLFTRYSALFNVYGGNKLGKFNDTYNINRETQNIPLIAETIEGEVNMPTRGGRFGIDISHIKPLLTDSSFEDIIEKLNSKFSLFLNDFVILCRKERHPKQHILNKIFEKSNFNNYYKQAGIVCIYSDENNDNRDSIMSDSEFEDEFRLK